MEEYIVRRLTPTECERLQGYEDGWMDLEPIADMSEKEFEFWQEARMQESIVNGKKFTRHKSKEHTIKWYNRMIQADSNKYKAIGNSIAIPQWWWLFNRMKPYLHEGATLGSLFDGIGGFPCAWEECYGKGTAIWASEIEPFCIAVTMERFNGREDDDNG